MKNIKGPALFLAQFATDEAPFNSWDSITKWAADCGYKGVQVPSWDARGDRTFDPFARPACRGASRLRHSF